MEDTNLALERLNHVINQSECRLNTILSTLGWSKEMILQPECVHHKNNNRSLAAVEKGSKLEETFPSSFHPADSPFSMQMDNIKQAEAILEGLYKNPSFELGVPLEEISSREPPRNVEDLQVNFTREERLSLYEHVVKNTLTLPDVPDIKIRFKRDFHSEEKQASWAEIAMIERDARRRNPKHRVARNPLTYSEEIRHLIHIQTEALAHHVQQQPTKPRTTSNRGSQKKSKRLRRSRSKSVDAERRQKKKKRARSRSRSTVRSHKSSNKSPDRKHCKVHKKHKKKHDR